MFYPIRRQLANNLTASRFFNRTLLGVRIPEEKLCVVFDLLLETRARVFICYPDTEIEFRKEKKTHERQIKVLNPTLSKSI